MNAAANVVSIEQKRAEYMGKPQIEDGYLRIANELFDAVLKFPFTGRQMAVVMAIMRKTYGYNKTEDDIPLSQIAEMTGISKGNISEAINALCEAGIVIKKAGRHSHKLSINKHYLEWKPVPKTGKGSQNGNDKVPEMGTKEFPNRETQKTNQKTIKNIMSGKPDDAAEIIAYLNAVAGTKFRTVKANLSLITARMKEGATLEQIKAVIDRKNADWPVGDKMRKYLRPETLFNATKFESYLGQLSQPATAAVSSGVKSPFLGAV